MTGPGVGAVVAYLVVAGAAAVGLAAAGRGGAARRAGDRRCWSARCSAGCSSADGRLPRAAGRLTARFGDLAGGLRVLNGLGGKEALRRRATGATRAAAAAQGYRVGAVTSWVQALGLGLPALFLAAVTWLAARMAAAGHHHRRRVGRGLRLRRGPGRRRSRSSSSAATDVTARPGRRRPGRPLPGPGARPGRTAADGRRARGARPCCATRPPASRWRPGRLTALVSARPAGVGRRRRPARPVRRPPTATWGAGPARRRRAAPGPGPDPGRRQRGRPVRRHRCARSSSGRRDPDDAAIARAVRTRPWRRTSSRGLPDGLDSADRRAGPQPLRRPAAALRLARALLADPEVLLAVEPTSARRRAHRGRRSPSGCAPPGRAAPPSSPPPRRCCWTGPTSCTTWSTAGSPPPAPTANCSARRARLPRPGGPRRRTTPRTTRTRRDAGGGPDGCRDAGTAPATRTRPAARGSRAVTALLPSPGQPVRRARSG